MDSKRSTGSLDQQPLHVTSPESHRFLLLDALRGIASLFIVSFHFPSAMTASIAANGPLAVDFFFCLSGFIIAFSYENRLAKGLSFKDFTVTRMIRLYPIYALGSLVGMLVSGLMRHFVFHYASWPALSSLLALAIFLWPTRLSPFYDSQNYPLNPPAWSLFCQLAANFAYALLIKLRIARTAALLCIVAGSLALLVNAEVLGGRLDAGGRHADFSLGLARVTFSFFLGVLICRLYRDRPRRVDIPWIEPLIPAVIPLLLIAILNSPLAWMRTESFRLLAITLCFPAMVYYGALARLPHSTMRFATTLGKLSYPLYLLHIPFVWLVRAHRLMQFTATHPAIAHLAALCMVAILAFLSWRVGERVDLPLRRALTRRYNAYKLAKQTPIPTAQHDDA